MFKWLARMFFSFYSYITRLCSLYTSIKRVLTSSVCSNSDIKDVTLCHWLRAVLLSFCCHNAGREGQQGLACIAKILNMYVAGNIIEERPCKGQDSCPCDGHYQYNTNVIYNKTGCLVARYRKAHLYEKELLRLDKPPTQEYVYFDTEYGRFGTEICFDITFKQPGVDLVEKYGIDHLVFPTYWPNDLGFLFANMVQWSSGWARRMGVNFLAANVHNMSRYSYGSAISSPNAVLNSTYITGPSAGTLLTADLDIPCAPKQKMLVQHDLPHNEVTNFQDQITTSVYQVVKLAGFLFNTTVLTGEKGLLEVTSEQLLCQLSFERSTTNETFLLAAYSGPSLFSTHIEVCLLQKCLNPDPSSCNNRDNEWSRTSFPKLILRGRFRHNYVLPSITGSFYQYTEIDWDFHHVKDRNYIISKDKTTPMLTVSMLGVW